MLIGFFGIILLVCVLFAYTSGYNRAVQDIDNELNEKQEQK
jgi:hypothetical protein